MSEQYPIIVDNITKSFKVYLDKGQTLKDLALFSKRRKFENRQVLKGISFQVARGEAVALIGHNGCGKSTTLKLLTRIMYPDTGRIEMKGRVSSLIELGAGFHPDMSGRENIYINASIFGLTKKEIDARIDEIIAFSELQEFIDNPVRTYSSGMYMRLAFAVAINVDADILLIDEILAVGDANFQAKCFEKLRELKASGITIVLVSHDMGTIKLFCDRAIWINEGEIAAEGNASDVVDTYLVYMNQKRIVSINEAKKVLAEEEQKRNMPKGELPQTMDPTAKHFGTGQVQMTACRILNEKNEEVDALDSKEKFRIRFEYKVNDPSVTEIVVGMGIFTLDHVWIMGTNSSLNNVKVPVTTETGAVVMECEPLKLLSNRYILQCSIILPDSTPCDYYNEYSHFNVVNNSRESGFVHYDTNWHIENAA